MTWDIDRKPLLLYDWLRFQTGIQAVVFLLCDDRHLEAVDRIMHDLMYTLPWIRASRREIETARGPFQLSISLAKMSCVDARLCVYLSSQAQNVPLLLSVQSAREQKLSALAFDAMANPFVDGVTFQTNPATGSLMALMRPLELPSFILARNFPSTELALMYFKKRSEDV